MLLLLNIIHPFFFCVLFSRLELGFIAAAFWMTALALLAVVAHVPVWLAARSRDIESPEDVDAIADAVEGSVRVRVRAHRMACREVYRRFPDREVGTAQVFSRFSREGGNLLVDIDLEVPVGVPSAKES